MLIHQAKKLAQQCVAQEVGKSSDFHSAYIAGSTMALPDDAELPATSDLDLNVVRTSRSSINSQAAV
jgi:hypothetical protein